MYRLLRKIFSINISNYQIKMNVVVQKSKNLKKYDDKIIKNIIFFLNIFFFDLKLCMKKHMNIFIAMYI